ncbi:MAG TPA: phosphoribosylanthranilate isomerase [Ignavibacteria bacterium]|nr:phosphoribosylanthranilate isomerase [Ignavibacteria bacterium]
MEKVKKPVVKICCISSVGEALTAIEFGASALGLVSKMPSGPGIISDDLIVEIVKIIPPEIDSFLLTSEIKAEKIISQHEKIGTNTIQIVDEIDIKEYSILKKEIPEIKIVQVIHVVDDSSIDIAKRVSEFADAILLDSGNPALEIKLLGGTGKVHNWEISRKIRDSVKIPLYLAGGLNSENVTDAIRTVKPYGVDLCSGVRTNGFLDREKLKNFFDKVNLFKY